MLQGKKHEPHKNTICTPRETRQIKCKNVKTCTTNVNTAERKLKIYPTQIHSGQQAKHKHSHIKT
jgi:hypothetical protein